MAGKGFSKGHKKVGGRVKGTPNAINTDARRKIQEHAGDAVEALLKIIRDPTAKDTAIVAAANSILDRAWGKPSMSMQVAGNDGAPLIPVDRPPRIETYEEWRTRIVAEMGLGPQ
jgi:hypothetical protein